MRQDKTKIKQVPPRLLPFKSTKVSVILLFLLFSFLFTLSITKPAQSESEEVDKKERDYLAIGVNAGTLITCALGIAGTIWTVSKKQAQAEFLIKEDIEKKLNINKDDLDKKLKTITELSAAKNDEGLQRDAQTKTELATSISEIKTLLVTHTGNSVLAMAELRHDLEKSISVNLAEIVRVHHKFEVSTFQTETALEAQESAYKRLEEKVNLSNQLAEERYVNLQREIQTLLRSFHYRLSDTEKVLETKHGFIPRRDPINIDIEGIG